MCNINTIIYSNIIELMEKKGYTAYSLAKSKKIRRSYLEGKIAALKVGNSITTIHLQKIADLLEIPVHFLLK